jgi:hypothetical protein
MERRVSSTARYGLTLPYTLVRESRTEKHRLRCYDFVAMRTFYAEGAYKRRGGLGRLYYFSATCVENDGRVVWHSVVRRLDDGECRGQPSGVVPMTRKADLEKQIKEAIGDAIENLAGISE